VSDNHPRTFHLDSGVAEGTSWGRQSCTHVLGPGRINS